MDRERENMLTDSDIEKFLEEYEESTWKVRRANKKVYFSTAGYQKMLVYSEVDCTVVLKTERDTPSIFNTYMSTRYDRIPETERVLEIRKGINCICLCQILSLDNGPVLSFTTKKYFFTHLDEEIAYKTAMIIVHETKIPKLRTKAAKKIWQLFKTQRELAYEPEWGASALLYEGELRELTALTSRQQRLMEFNLRGLNNESCLYVFPFIGHFRFLFSDNDDNRMDLHTSILLSRQCADMYVHCNVDWTCENVHSKGIYCRYRRVIGEYIVIDKCKTCAVRWN